MDDLKILSGILSEPALQNLQSHLKVPGNKLKVIDNTSREDITIAAMLVKSTTKKMN